MRDKKTNSVLKLSLSILIYLGSPAFCMAQKGGFKEEIVKCEMGFALEAANHGLKFAFDKNMDSIGMLVNGTAIVNGLKAYSKAKSDTVELLSWKPAYAIINKHGDFGFTTGPYLYYSNRQKAPIASGNYFSIWKKNGEKIFKILFDGGVNHKIVKEEHRLALKSKELFFNKVLTSSKAVQMTAPPELKDSEGILEHLADDVVVLRPDMPVMVGKNNYKQLSQANKNYMVRKGQGFDKSGRFFYCYGNLLTKIPNGSESKYPGYFVQVWKYEKGWKIIADVAQLSI